MAQLKKMIHNLNRNVRIPHMLNIILEYWSIGVLEYWSMNKF